MTTTTYLIIAAALLVFIVIFQIAKANGLEADAIEVKWGEAHTADMLKGLPDRESDATLVAWLAVGAVVYVGGDASGWLTAPYLSALLLAVLTYLVGELWRRVGDPKSAKAWLVISVVDIQKPSTDTR